MTGTIFNVQHYAVHDGPGIRTLVFLKGCPLHCSWCCNPESQLLRPQIRFISMRCKACLECVSHCPSCSLSVSGSVLNRSFADCLYCQSKDCIEACNFDALSLSGKQITSGELVEIISRDIPFYKNSGGGVTFSGGEPLMQPAFLLDVLRKCKALDIHTAVETCGWADMETFQRILPFTDLFLFDLKIIDPELHIEYTGKPVGPILENLAFLASAKAEIIIRFPLVPGISYTLPNMDSVAEVMNKNDLKHICLEPYHTLGKEKYEEHGMTYHLNNIGNCNQDQIKAACNHFTMRGLLCDIV
jgi:pyruvate formate lyase activating enzyme